MTGTSDEATLRALATWQLTPVEVGELRALFAAAWPDPDEGFDDEDWRHATGGTHVVLELEGRIVSHASVVTRWIHVDGVPIRTGYVEAVATLPAFEGRGHGSRVMTAIGAIIAEQFDLGVLGTGRHAFYERLGWERWQGPSFVLGPDGPVRSPDEDDGVMVRRTPSSPPIDPTAPIACEWRPGDAW
jgi:aminoglycoside 2'-N-acetyltransferase I